jgi:hypothetical protein
MTGVPGATSPVAAAGKGGIPAGDTMILAFSGSGGPGGTSLGAGGIITGHVFTGQPRPPSGGGGSG